MLFPPLLHIIYLLLIGFATGILAGLTAIGGGAIIVPALSEIFGLDMINAVATSLFTIVFTSSSTAYGHLRQRNLDLKSSALIAVPAVMFSVLGAYTAMYLGSDLVRVIFALFLVGIAIRMAYHHLQNTMSVEVSHKRYILPLIGSLGGFVSGLLGLGGGVVMVPFLVIFASIPIKRAVGITAPVVLLNAIFGSVPYITAGKVLFTYSITLACATIPGAQIGAYLHKKGDNEAINIVMVVILIITAAKMLFSALSGL